MAETKHVRMFLSELATPVQSSEDKAFWVGQKIPIVIEVLSETHFSGATRFSLPDIPGAVFYKPEERAVVMSREIDGQSYSVQRHEFSLYPQRQGEFTIPAFSVRFGIAGALGESPQQHDALTDPLQVKAILPPGAEGVTSLISTTDLKVTESWSPNVAELEGPLMVGNAIKRRITFSAPDMPGMAFPDLRIPAPQGLKIYRNRAEVHDKLNRGFLTGQRVDSLTYVCQEAGSYHLPAIQIVWWDLGKQSLKTITLPGLDFDVLPAPSEPGSDTGAQNEDSKPWFMGLSVIVLIMAGTLWFLKPAILVKWSHWKLVRQESEAAYFRKISSDLTPVEMYHAMNQWLSRTSLAQSAKPHEAMARILDDPSFDRELVLLQDAIVGRNPDWNGQLLLQHLKLVRQLINQQNRCIFQKPKDLTLKSLNPQ